MANNSEPRSLFEWSIFTIVHVVLFGGTMVAGFYTYDLGLGVWVAAQAIIAGMALTYLFAREVAGETLMKVLVYAAEVANIGYLVHNGAKRIGVEAFNAAQIQKYESGMAAAASSASRRVAETLGASAKSASEVATLFDDGTAIIASVLAGVSLFVALVVLSLASRRHPSQSRQGSAKPAPENNEDLEPFEWPDEREEAGNGFRHPKAHR